MAVTVYEARPGIHLPLEPTHPLLSVIKQALAKEPDSTTGHVLAAALLDNVLQAVDTAQGPHEADSFPHLLVSLLCDSEMLTDALRTSEPCSFGTSHSSHVAKKDLVHIGGLVIVCISQVAEVNWLAK